MKTLKDILAAQRTNLTAQQTALAGVLPKLPEALRASLTPLKDAIDQQLAKLPELEKAADPDAVAYLGSLCTELNSQHERLLGLVSGFGAVQAELDGLKGQITAGEYVAKARVTAAIEEARTALRSELAGEIAAARKGVLETAGLPVPPAEILALPAADFTARQQVCAANVKTITERCAAPKARTALIAKHAWQSAEAVVTELDSLADLLTGGKAAGDPLLGTPGAPPPAAPAKRPLAVM